MSESEERRWNSLLGGYRVPYDPRSTIAKLGAGESDAAWTELWQELHHQGDVDTASYAAVPELVFAYQQHGVPDWNVYALIGTIELERGRGKNPEVPDWLASRYRDALDQLAELAFDDLRTANDLLVVRSALAILAIAKNLRVHARVLLELDESEIEEMLHSGEGIAKSL